MNKPRSDVINHKSDALVVRDITGTRRAIYKLYHALSRVLPVQKYLQIKMFRILFFWSVLDWETYLQQIQTNAKTGLLGATGQAGPDTCLGGNLP